MAIDKLQEKIRKLKNPSMLDLSVPEELIPPHLWEEEGTTLKAYGRYYHELLSALHGVVPAVRVRLSFFVLMGQDGMTLLRDVTKLAKEHGFYVLLDAPETLSPFEAENAAKKLLSSQCAWYFDGLLISAYAGSDILKPYVSRLKEAGKDLFVVMRTANKSASEFQDMLSGSRLMYMAVADKVNRQSEGLVGRSGYSQVAGVGPASNADSLKNLRTKYPSLFLLIDGYDYTNSNAKNCAQAFDKFGHGAIACGDIAITGAWKEARNNGREYIMLSVAAAERMKKNLLRYITVL